MKSYSYEEAVATSKAYFGNDELPAHVFVGKYALQDLNGTLYELTPDDMHHRLAREFARIERNYANPLNEDEIYDLFSSWKVVAQGGPMSAIGNEFQYQSTSNCFVIKSPYDSYAGIMKTDQEEVQIMKRRGGVGFDMSTIRPKGLPAANAARTTDGIGVFMERYSNTCREVAQGGRRGALMLTLSVHHPEVLTFANVKRDSTKVTGANVSIRVTDEFMLAVERNEKYQQRFPVDKDVEHSVEQWVDARTVWNNIVLAMRDCSEPGMLFWDTTHKMSPSEAYSNYQYISTNPCGEQPLPGMESCRLMLVNLWKFVKSPFTTGAYFDFDEFSETVVKTQRLMDDLVDLEIEAIDRILTKIASDPEPDDVKYVEVELWKKIRTTAVDCRRTGLGPTALGDAIAGVNLKYGSDESIEFTEKVYRTLALASYSSSVQLARERGSFPAFSHAAESDHPFIKRIMDKDESLKALYNLHGRRNIAITTTAPAGSTSIMTQTTSGCEPVLFLKSRRKRKITAADKLARVDEVDAMGDMWQHYDLIHPGLVKWMEVTGESDVTKSPYHGSTVEEIDWLKKVDLQAAAQKWVCSGISNTTNLPKDVKVEDVEALCWRAWKTGCKGVTVYRKGSRAAVIVDETSSTQNGQPMLIVETHAPKRPKELECDVQRVTIKGEQYLVLVGLLEGRPYEVFAGLSEHVEVPRKAKKATLIKNGKREGVSTYNLRIPIGDDEHLVLKDVVSMFDNPEHGALTRVVSMALRHGVPIQFVSEQLKKDKHSDLQGFSTVLARVLKGYINDGTEVTAEKGCPMCGQQLVYQGGCVQCTSCTWGKC